MQAGVTTRVRVGCEFTFSVPDAVSAVFQVEPQNELRQQVLGESLSFDPWGTHTSYQDSFGNRCSRLPVEPGPFSLRYDATVEVPRALDEADFEAPEDPIADVPSDVLLYLLPSAYSLSEMLVAEAWYRFGDVKPGWNRVQTIMDTVHNHLTFGYGTSFPNYTAAEAFTAGQGVCRDFAHLAIAFCRALNIPARYAFGYLPFIDVATDGAPPDFAAWTEVWLGGRWWTFDPRNNERRIGRVVIGRGRDAVDVAMVTTYGTAWLENMTVWADEIYP